MTGWWTAAFVAQWVLLFVLATVVVALARQVGALHLRLGPLGALEIDDEGPPLGEMLAATTVAAPGDERVLLGGPAASGRVVFFTSPTCPVCKQVLPALPAAARAAGFAPQVVSDPDAESRLAIPGTPYVLVLDGPGIVRAKGTVNSMEQLDGLVDTAERRIAEGRVELEAM